jgi:hypothetical protein
MKTLSVLIGLALLATLVLPVGAAAMTSAPEKFAPSAQAAVMAPEVTGRGGAQVYTGAAVPSAPEKFTLAEPGRPVKAGPTCQVETGRGGGGPSVPLLHRSATEKWAY